MDEKKTLSPEELRAKIRSRIQEKQINRSSKHTKKHILDETFDRVGVDKDEFIENIKKMKKNT